MQLRSPQRRKDAEEEKGKKEFLGSGDGVSPRGWRAEEAESAEKFFLCCVGQTIGCGMLQTEGQAERSAGAGTNCMSVEVVASNWAAASFGARIWPTGSGTEV